MGQRFEVPYELAGKTISLVVDPHTEQAVLVENDQGERQGEATPLDVVANVNRRRRKPDKVIDTGQQQSQMNTQEPNLVEIAHQQYYGTGELTVSEPVKEER